MMYSQLVVTVLWVLLPLLANSLPPGFVSEFVIKSSAVTGTFASNPRKNGKPMLVIASDSGKIRVLEDPDETDEASVILDLRLERKEICTNGERGLQSLVFHPNFETNLFVYVFYTGWREGCLEGLGYSPSNVVDRYRMDPDTLELDKDTREEIWRGTPTVKQNHNGGAMAFGNDGKLYVTTGDGGDRSSVQPLNNTHGSIIRLNDDGSIPSDNPFVNPKKFSSYRCADSGGFVPADAPEKAVCSEVFANGFRNPFRIEMDPNETEKVKFAVSDVGGNYWEELSWAGTDFAAKNYGYPKHEGPCLHGYSDRCQIPENKDILEPFHWYAHRRTQEGGCVTGSVFVPNNLGWPSKFKFLFADFIFFEIYNLIENPEAYCRACIPPIPAYTNETFYEVPPGEIRGSITDIFFGPYKDTQALYVVMRGGKESVVRIRYTGILDNSPPVPVIKLKDRGYSYTVNEEFLFDASDSNDPDGDELEFRWDFGDGTSSKLKAPTHSYQKPGKYLVKLIVTDVAGLTQQTSMTVSIGNPPTVSIISPTEDDEFFVGQIFQLRGEAFDYDGKRLDSTSLTWEVRKHHADHFHPFLDPTHGNDLDLFPAPEPEDFFASTNSYLRIILKATDKNGLTTEIDRIIQPSKINVGIESNLPGVEVTVDAYPVRTSEQIVSWKNHKLHVLANDKSPFIFRSWWDGNTQRERKITITEDGQSVLALFCAQENWSCSSDDECCGGLCTRNRCNKFKQNSHLDAKLHDEADVEDEVKGSDTAGFRNTTIDTATSQKSFEITNTFAIIVIISATGLIVASLAGWMVRRRWKKKKLAKCSNDVIKNNLGRNKLKLHSGDEEKGISNVPKADNFSDATDTNCSRPEYSEDFVEGSFVLNAMLKLGMKPASATLQNKYSSALLHMNKPQVGSKVETHKMTGMKSPKCKTEVFDETNLDPKDIELVMSQTGCSHEKAARALKENASDLVSSIMSLLTDDPAEVANDQTVNEIGIDPKDIELVMSQTGCNREKATRALNENVSDLVSSIMSLFQ